mmetsp:Transcript_1744/g.2703  ORF Transcript_1744/g.2703 Transcript_1744/m.2703 type:complete len:215 (-) Transcript_1744:47-691(-)
MSLPWNHHSSSSHVARTIQWASHSSRLTVTLRPPNEQPSNSMTSSSANNLSPSDANSASVSSTMPTAVDWNSSPLSNTFSTRRRFLSAHQRIKSLPATMANSSTLPPLIDSALLIWMMRCCRSLLIWLPNLTRHLDVNITVSTMSASILTGIHSSSKHHRTAPFRPRVRWSSCHAEIRVIRTTMIRIYSSDWPKLLWRTINQSMEVLLANRVWA